MGRVGEQQEEEEGQERERKVAERGEKKKRKSGGRRRCRAVLQLSVSNTRDPLADIMCLSVQP